MLINHFIADQHIYWTTVKDGSFGDWHFCLLEILLWEGKSFLSASLSLSINLRNLYATRIEKVMKGLEFFT